MIAVELDTGKIVNMDGAMMVDIVGPGTDAHSCRVYKTVAGKKVLLQQKRNAQKFFDYTKPSPELVAEVNAMRPKDKDGNIEWKPSAFALYH
jgi:hypothetical protein